MTLRKFLLAAVLTLMIVSVIAGVVIRRHQKRAVPRVTAAQVEADIHQHVPVGSSRADVSAYLDTRKVGHTYYGSDDYKDTRYYNCEVGLMRDTSSSGLIRTDIEIVFRFGSDMRLVSYNVQEINTGP